MSITIVAFNSLGISLSTSRNKPMCCSYHALTELAYFVQNQLHFRTKCAQQFVRVNNRVNSDRLVLAVIIL